MLTDIGVASYVVGVKTIKPVVSSCLILVFFFSCRPTNLKRVQNEFAHPEVETLVAILKSDLSLHKDVHNPVSDQEISLTESELGIKLPASYKHFLKKFGNGATWLYHVDQPVNGVQLEYGTIHWLGTYRTSLDSTIASDGFGTFEVKKLLCLMTENSNGGAWVWLTSESEDSGE